MEHLGKTYLDCLMTLHGPDLDSAIRLFKLNQIKESSEVLKKTFSITGRCQICTLKVPCKHCKELKNTQKLLNYQYQENFTIFTPLKRSVISKKGFLNIQQPHKNEKLMTSKNCELKRLEFLENLGKFKEKQLIQNISEIETQSKYLEIADEKKKIENLRKQKYFKVQKEKIRRYHSQLKQMIISSSKSHRSIKKIQTIETSFEQNLDLSTFTPKTSPNKPTLKNHVNSTQDSSNIH